MCFLCFTGSALAGRETVLEYPYLVSVESRWDVEAENYQQVFSWSRETFAQKISQIPGAAPVRADQVPDRFRLLKRMRLDT